MFKRFFDTPLFITAVVLITLSIAVSYFSINARINILKKQKYQETSNEIKSVLKIFIDEKKEALELISLALADDIKIKKAIIDHNRTELNLERFTNRLRNHTEIKNLWIQILLRDGTSFQRSWTDKSGDNISNVRLDIAKVVKEPRIMNSISVGKFDLTFKSTIPIEENNEVIGFIESIAKFNSITKKMKQRGVDMLILVDDAYKSQLKYPFTKTFVDEFYVANTDAKPELLDYVKHFGVEKILGIEEYFVAQDIHQLITIFHLNDVNNDPMGYFLHFKDLKSIDLEPIMRIRDRLVLLSSLAILLLASAFYYFYIKRYRLFMDKLNEKLEDEVANKTLELEEKNENLRHLAQHDPLTQLPNRLLFMDRLEQAIKQAKRRESTVSILFLDLDRFKEVNDTYGHEIGDKLLTETTSRLSASLRECDTIARLGGDEFTVIVEGLESKQLMVVVQKIITAMQAPVKINTHLLHASFSIGVSSYPNDGDSPDLLLRNADTAMYKAKESGRNTYAFYDHTMTEKMFARIIMEREIRKAIEDEAFHINYQPKLNARTNTVIGLEALIRWNHPKKGFISPVEFIPLAEEIGLIDKIDEWMMRNSLKTVKKWRNQGLSFGRLSLNTSMKQLEDKQFVEQVKSILVETDCSASLLELEITEGQIMKNPKLAINALSAFRTLGIHISVDDFGTGYSSLSYLKRLPINSLKIDRSFIQDIVSSEDDAAIVRTIIVLGKSMKLGLIAEGVETQEQKDYLVGYGCENIQGYFYSKPLNEEDCCAFLKAHTAEELL